MDVDASASATPEPDATSRRRSKRVVRAPAKYAPEPAAAAAPKRKRDQNDGQEAENDESGLDEHMSDDEGDGDGDDDAQSDQDHPPPRSRKARPRARKPSSKKPKLNGAKPSGPAQIARIPSRPKKSVRIEAGEKGTGLFAEIFGSGASSSSISQQWLERYEADDAAALADLINSILQCAGCDLEVTVDDVRDPENIPNRLVDLQSSYQEQQIIDYPLISKGKVTRSFRDMLVGFYHSLVELLHETDTLYKDADLMDNLHAWLASMSSSALRPFRHTATTISLAVQTSLVDVASVLDRRIANMEQQLQAAKKGKNKAKAVEVQRGLAAANGYRKTCSEGIQSFFDTVFVHRYRDVDPKIRVECVDALGTWILSLPTVFMEPGYLRYLGWMLTDENAQTRQEVLKQLLKVFRRDAQQLGHFIDRFRPRLIEIATLDSEVSVRVTAISVIDSLRSAAMLDPHEIDAIGKLIFDSELRIRKAVVNFFVACVADVLESKKEQIGGQEVLDELEEVDEDDDENPRKEWINIKCLAETLASYDAQIEEARQSGADAAAGIDAAVELLDGANPDTRTSLAAQALYEKVPEVNSWGMIAGYLLYDHTTSSKSMSRSKSKASSPEAAFKLAVAPSPKEEAILLDVLGSAVRTSLVLTNDHDKGKRRLGRSEAQEAQEEVAVELVTVIPRLLNKFGAEPETAAIVLRLERCLNLNTFQQLRQDSGRFERLLDEISTQFNRHDDKRVLTEATAALLHARQHEELEELTDSKLSLLWDNAINALRNFDQSCELSVRGNLAEAPLRQLSTVLMKISKLASISDCVDVLEAKDKSSDSSSSAAIQLLIQIVHRGKYEPQEDEIDDLEDEVVTFAIKACQFYFMWKTRALAKLLTAGIALSDDDLDELSLLRQSYRRHLIETFSSRAAIDQLRLFSTGSLCDLHLTLATLRSPINNFRPASDAAAHRAEKLKTLLQDIEPGLVPELMSIFDGAERQYAKKTKRDKMLNEPADDEDPLDDEDLDDGDADDDEDEDDNDVDLTPEARYAAQLKCERAFCELTAKYVLTLSAHLIDNRGSMANKLRRRILRNETKLGNNFKEVVAYLDEDKLKRRQKKPVGTVPSKPKEDGHPRVPSQDPERNTAQNEHDEDGQSEHVFDEEGGEPEDGTAEDLRRRELLDEDDVVIDDDKEEEVEEPAHQDEEDDDDDDDDDDGLGD